MSNFTLVAEATNEFKVVFPKGNPTFEFQYFNLVNDKLLVIYMLNAYYIDTTTGEILWNFQF